MSKSVNKCTFIGRLGKNPDYRENQETQACSFTIACSDDYKDKATGNITKKTNWIKIVAFGKLASICQQYLFKGSLVYIEGKYTTRKWQNKNGQDQYTTEIVAKEMQMLGEKNQEQNKTLAPAIVSFDDDIPF